MSENEKPRPKHLGCSVLLVVCAFVGACWLVAWGVKLLGAIVRLVGGA